MKQKGKIQTNEFGINVLVEHVNAIGNHYHYSDKLVLCEKMTQEEIDKAFAELISKLSTADKIAFLKKQAGFAISNVRSKDDSIYYGDLFKYELI
jgi:predicted 3-demethylubiquinone-9 3-methyltransferase (glyoxalase superfamily)